ncbi:MAG: hypothetical protein KKF12_22060 [Proteobacteria bacterium]|nr:hypothetical protein [Pseudomonadota bacterium]
MAPAKEKTRQEDIKEKISLFFAKVGGLSKVQRLLICVLTIAVLGTAYYYFIFVPKNEVLIAVRAEHKSQVEKLETFKQKAKAEINKEENRIRS